MKIILDLPDEQLAALWFNTWEERSPDKIAVRVADVVQDAAGKALIAFPMTDEQRADLTARFLQSKCAATP